MAFLVFALSLVLLVAGLAGGYQSLDLLPTGIGVLYAISGAFAVCAAILTLALGVMIRRIDALAELVRRQQLGAVVAAEAVPIGQAFAPAPFCCSTGPDGTRPAPSTCPRTSRRSSCPRARPN